MAKAADHLSWALQALPVLATVCEVEEGGDGSGEQLGYCRDDLAESWASACTCPDSRAVMLILCGRVRVCDPAKSQRQHNRDSGNAQGSLHRPSPFARLGRYVHPRVHNLAAANPRRSENVVLALSTCRPAWSAIRTVPAF